MFEEMFEANWAKIVYGRSYHLDFRFITIPTDFAKEDLAWAAEHILATTRQARNLVNLPRWSLFKNDRHCVIGVTCMVRDLLGQLGEDGVEVMAKDDLGRPLYLFVGYVTRLGKNKSLSSFPAYTGQHLTAFKPLYQQLEKVWLVKDYEANSRHPLLSEYEALKPTVELISTEANVEQLIKLNNQHKSPQKIFLWSNSTDRNNQLWIAAAKCSVATSVCLDIKDKSIANSPFLNQSVTQLEQFTTCDRLSKSRAQSPSPTTTNISQSLPQKISHRAKADIGITLEQAAKVAVVGQELIERLGDRSTPPSIAPDLNAPSETSHSYGFKTKNQQDESSPQERDWF